MHSLLFKNTLREIKHSFGRFIAILLIIGLGVGFFAGLRVAKTAMLRTADTYITENSLFDYRLISTLGFTDDDVEKAESLPGVSVAEGAFFADFIGSASDTERVFRAHSITEGVNKLSLKSGRMPQSADECVVDSNAFSDKMIGEKITVSDINDEEIKDKLSYSSYTIVGVADSVYYMNFERGTSSVGNGGISGFIYIPFEGFKSEAYAEIFLKLQNPGFIYSNGYNDAVEAFETKAESFCEERADARYKSIKEEANEKLSQAMAEYNDGKAEYEASKETALTELADAKSALENAGAEIENYEYTLSSAKSELESKRAELEAGFKTAEDSASLLQKNISDFESVKTAAYEDFETQKTATETRLAAVNTTLSDISLPETDRQEALLQKAGLETALSVLETKKSDFDKTVSDTERAFDEAQKKIDDTVSGLNSASAILSEKETELYANANLLESRKLEYDEAEKQYNDSKASAEEEFEKAEAELLDAEAKISEAQEKINEIKAPETFTLTRDSNIGYACFKSDSDIVMGISRVFPLFFLLVAVLVCVTTMTRMIDEERVGIGVLKALGYSDGAVISKYVIYSGSAAVIGGAGGFMLGSLLIPKAIWMAYDIMYGFAPIEFVFDIKLFLPSMLAAILCSAGSTLIACGRELLLCPSELIRPKAPKNGKRVFLEKITFIWKRLKFMQKVSIRNVLRYKNRFLMMILGIGGCTALLITGFGIRDSIANIADDQYGKITVYDISAVYSGETPEDIFTSDAISEYTTVCSKTITAVCGGIEKECYMISSEKDGIENFVKLFNETGSITYPKKGEAVINKKLSETLGVGIGDEITVRNSELREFTVKLTGIIENYVYNYVFISDDTWESAFNTLPEHNTAYINIKDGCDLHSAGAEIMGNTAVSSVTVSKDLCERIKKMMNSLDYIVWMVIICAGALAFIVLYNLTNINITEREREIATLKVLGFSGGETSSYVLRENIALTFIGAVFGIPLGILLHRFVMSQIKIDMVAFDIKVLPASFILSFALTFVFTVVVDLVLSRKINKIDMANSLKSIE